MSVRVLFVSVIALAAAALCWSAQPVLAGTDDIDSVFVVQCCVDSTIAQSSFGPCTASFCADKAKEQVKVLRELAQKRKNVTPEAIKASMRGEMAKTVSALLAKKVVAKATGKDPEVDKDAVDEEDNKALQPGGGVAFLENPFLHNPSLWPNARVAFSWQVGIDPGVQGDFQLAIGNYQARTCVRFVPTPAGAGVVDLQSAAAGAGSVTFGMGRHAASCVVQQGASQYVDAAHELGHVLGADHTMIRKRRWFYVNFQKDECEADFRARECNVTDPFFTSNAASLAGICTTAADITNLQAQGRVPATYNQTNATQLQNCQIEACIVNWLAQYAITTDRNVGSYKYASIMHYPFDNCIAPRRLPYAWQKRPVPQGSGIINEDFQSMNEAYDCRKTQLHCARRNPQVTMPPVEIYVHHSWTQAQLISDFTRICNIANINCVLTRKTTILGSTRPVPNGDYSSGSDVFMTCD